MKRLATGWLIAMATWAHAATLSVPDDYPTIQAAMDAASPLDTVAVSPGVYQEHIRYNGKSIVVRGIAGRDSTVIQGYLFQVPVVRFVTGEGSGAVLEGFTVRFARDAPGIECYYSRSIIQHCDISRNEEEGRGGHGVLCRGNALPTIRFNRIHDNAAQVGGAIRVTDTAGAEIHHNELFGNWAAAGSAVYMGNGTQLNLTHNLIHGNQKGASVLVTGRNQVSTIRNNAFVGNGGGVAVNSNAADLRNNIIVSNRGTALSVRVGTVGYNCHWDYDTSGTPGVGDILADPLFTDPGTGDFSLQLTSPCLDAGDPDPAYNDPDGSRGDIGPGPVQGLPHVPWWQDCPIPLNGDINGSGTITSADLIYCINYVFKSGATPLPCAANADVTCTKSVTASDIIQYLNYLFLAADSGMALKGGGDPLCIICRMVYYGEAPCP